MAATQAFAFSLSFVLRTRERALVRSLRQQRAEERAREPIRHVPFLQPDLRLSAADVRRLSPAGFPAPRGPLHAVVGGLESEEFLRQNALIRERWGAGVVPVCEAIPGADHFTVLDHLADPAGRIHQLARGLLFDGT